MNQRTTLVALLISITIVCAAFIETVIKSDLAGALVIGAFLTSLVLLSIFRKHVAEFAIVSFSIAAVFNTIGYRWNLYRAPGPFDEVAHAYSSFAVTLIFGQLLYADYSQSFKNRFFIYLFTVANTGIAIGVTWEFFEWCIAILGDLNDTLSDLLLDWIGAAAAATIIAMRARKSISYSTEHQSS